MIGAGPAGVSAAVEAARLGFEPLLFDGSGSAGGLVREAFEVRNLPGGVMAGCEVAAQFAELLGRWGIPVVHASIASVECGMRGVVLRDPAGGAMRASAVVAATGTEAVEPSIEGLPGSFGPGFYPSARALLAGSPEGSACVIGGGDAAFD
ncbi:MAG: FAD-dependent oxidoreductase [Candidatus Fermentibacter sp.]|nr:FAD-dependent oxidoreductase [Candidatus Fermentibacter sp.]